MQNQDEREEIAWLQLSIIEDHEMLAIRTYKIDVLRAKVQLLASLHGQWRRALPPGVLGIVYEYLEPMFEWNYFPILDSVPSDALLPYDPLHFMSEDFPIYFHMNVDDQHEVMRLRILRKHLRNARLSCNEHFAFLNAMYDRLDFVFLRLREKCLGIVA